MRSFISSILIDCYGVFSAREKNAYCIILVVLIVTDIPGFTSYINGYVTKHRLWTICNHRFLSLSLSISSIVIMDRNAGCWNLCDQISNVNGCQRRSNTCGPSVSFGEDKKMTNLGATGDVIFQTVTLGRSRETPGYDIIPYPFQFPRSPYLYISMLNILDLKHAMTKLPIWMREQEEITRRSEIIDEKLIRFTTVNVEILSKVAVSTFVSPMKQVSSSSK